MIEAWVELSRENPGLARAELDGAVHALGGRISEVGGDSALVPVELPERSALSALAGRLALGRYVVERWNEPTPEGISNRLRGSIRAGETVAFRPLGRPRSRATGPAVAEWAEAVRAAGGRIDLDVPDRRFRYETGSSEPFRFGEEAGAVDRTTPNERRMPRLPFRRPVSLPPKLGRVAANLGAVRPGDRILDPFLGTGMLAMESALLGARAVGVDSNAEMVRGAIENFAHLALEPEAFVVGDAGSVELGGSFDAIVTDPPYGRASSTGGEPAEALVRRVIRRWADSVRPGGRVVVVTPGGPDPLVAPWERTVSVADRVHRSLTREFRVYRRSKERLETPRRSDAGGA